MQKIILYGTGMYGAFTADYLHKNSKKLNVKVVAVSDKKIDKDNLFHSFPLIKREHIADYQYDQIVVSSKKWYDEIKMELISDFMISEKRIILFEDFLNSYNKDNDYFCNICKKNQKFFWPCGVNSPLFEELRIIGGGRRNTGACPYCGSIDRDRWVWYIIQNNTDILIKENNILHIAPEKKISEAIRSNHKGDYITGDLQPGRADAIVDLTQMMFDNDSFDYIICNHVMEHIPDEKLAFSEMKRCLKKNGTIILSFPMCKDHDTYEDEGVVSKDDRIRKYGQEDHCRLYGRDAVKHLENFGFMVKEFQADHILTRSEIKRLGLIAEDTVYLCRISESKVIGGR